MAGRRAPARVDEQKRTAALDFLTSISLHQPPASTDHMALHASSSPPPPKGLWRLAPPPSSPAPPQRSPQSKRAVGGTAAKKDSGPPPVATTGSLWDRGEQEPSGRLLVATDFRHLVESGREEEGGEGREGRDAGPAHILESQYQEAY